MKPYYVDDAVTVMQGDCLDVLAGMESCSVDAVVTDPPYGLEFMGKDWDGADGFRRSLNPADVGRDNAFGRTSCAVPDFPNERLPRLHDFQVWCEAWATECLRVLKPGGHMLAFGGTRTWHRLACAIEDAGFEVRDSIAWIYGSGFPKSLDVSKAIDKAAGAERAETGRVLSVTGNRAGPSAAMVTTGLGAVGVGPQEHRETAPATPAAVQWQGWGTALKPAFEPIVVARKPLQGTVAANVLAHGTGALNIDGCRVGTEGGTRRDGKADKPNDAGWENMRGHGIATLDAGRWPANVTLDNTQAAALDQQSGPSFSSNRPRNNTAEAHNRTSSMGNSSADWTITGYEDSGGASRFFPIFRYEPKAPTAERPRAGEVAHPTVKPLDLMRWLVRLVTPTGGLVLDPFAGSGTTAEACVLEGFRCLTIEREASYLPLITARLTKPLQPGLDFGSAS